MDWLKTLDSAQFATHWSVIHDAIFARRALPDNPLVNEAWKIVLVAYGINMTPATFNAIAGAARRCGDPELVIASADQAVGNTAATVLTWSFRRLTQARLRAGSLLGVVDTHLFGRSGRWGAVSACSLDDILITAGDQQFIGEVVAGCGGEDLMKTEWLAFSRTEWRIDDAIKNRVRALAGW